MEIKSLKKNLKHSLNNKERFALINVANIRSSLLCNNLVTSADSFAKFADQTQGIPILIPADKKLFLFEQKDVFILPKEQVLKTVYNLSDETYAGFKHAFNQFTFLTNFKVKETFQLYVEKLVKQNLDTVAYVTSLKKKFKYVGAFQTRNIPHFGHERIIQRMLEFCDHVVVNPVIGPKKKGDVSIECLKDVFTYLTKYKYQGKISFKPIFANMFYAGPREAMHHALMRQRMGFQHFTVGRDHAGAENAYEANMAAKFIKKSENKLKIDVMLHKGAVFCRQCKEVILIDDCDHPSEVMMDISGTDFRSSIMAERFFNLADKEMQTYLFKNNKDIFEK